MASLKELLLQQKELAVQIEAARKREIADAVQQARALVAEHGLTVEDVFPNRRGRKAAGGGAKVAPKYRDPATGTTWTGRGKPPRWIEGKDRAAFAIN
ncbi:H-NS family nucleoid-associated regulatory protein [Ottowia sp.]|uniref:H-NS histone family protein n=1 Tax=Ottowia sp. TaxID=1898956 RepID=UPI002C98BD49|nr:H-NS histone family protein [Ottowia sp.]